MLYHSVSASLRLRLNVRNASNTASPRPGRLLCLIKRPGSAKSGSSPYEDEIWTPCYFLQSRMLFKLLVGDAFSSRAPWQRQVFKQSGLGIVCACASRMDIASTL